MCDTDTSAVPVAVAVARRRRSEYRVDMWRSARRRWMVAGVLAALALAVLAPRAGAQGGALHAQYVWYLPLSYIYFAAGRRGACAGGAGGARLVLVGAAHAALVAPALAVLLLAGTQRSDVPYSLVQGVLISSLGSGCGWLSLALCAEAGAAPLTAACHLASLVTAPLALLLLCGRAVLPAPGAAAGSCAAALAAFAAGAAAARWAPGGARGAGRAERLCALALLYMQCCDALQTRGSVRLEDMFALLLLELSWLAMSAGACWGYARCGLLAPCDARTVALCALPRSPRAGWQGGAGCGGGALARLPGALLAPAQALVLAAIAPASPPRVPVL